MPLLYKMSRLSRLDVKYVDLFDANHPSFFAEHHNPNCELIAVADGTVHLEASGERLQLTAGDCLLLKPWESHGGWKAGQPQGRFFWIQFSCDPDLEEFHLHQAMELNIVHASQAELRTIENRGEDPLVVPRLFRPKQRYKLLGLFEELLAAGKKPKGNYRFQSTILLAQMLLLISDDWLEHARLDTAAPASYITYRRMMSYLNQYYMEPFPKETLERFMDRKYEYLCQVFKKYANTSIQQYVHQLRTQRAKYLLRQTNKPVKTIAQEVGYPDPFHFSRIFKKNAGVAPQHYRETGETANEPQVSRP